MGSIRSAILGMRLARRLAILLLLGWVGAAQADGVRRLDCLRASGHIGIDGRLDEDAWWVARSTGTFAEMFRTKDAARFLTRVRVLWDDDNLYVGFYARDDDLFATNRSHDAPLWEEEVLEVYIDPDGDGRDYAEIEVNALGTVIDLLIEDPARVPQWEEFAKWNCEGLRAAVSAVGTVGDRLDVDRGWTAELSIPFRSLLPYRAGPSVGDVWRIQFFRIERRRGQEDQPFCMAWSPTRTFHAPRRFGEIVFRP